MSLLEFELSEKQKKEVFSLIKNEIKEKISSIFEEEWKKEIEKVIDIKLEVEELREALRKRTEYFEKEYEAIKSQMCAHSVGVQNVYEDVRKIKNRFNRL